jgi:hypothetical protein
MPFSTGGLIFGEKLEENYDRAATQIDSDFNVNKGG